MASPSKLCSVCVEILQSGLEGVEKSLHKKCAHHKTFDGFKQAAESGCFICARLWDAVSDVSIVSWEEDPTTWKVFKCWVERRPWAPERYEPIYWLIRYLVFTANLTHDLKYKGNVFCLTPCKSKLRPPHSPQTFTQFGWFRYKYVGVIVG
jgi:hypothetical protein